MKGSSIIYPATVLLLAAILFQACLFNDSPRDCRRDIGLQIANLVDDEVVVPDTIGSQDSLILRLSADTRSSYLGEFSHIDIERSDGRIALTIWSHDHEWRCDDPPVPPTSLTVLRDHPLSIPPPFEPEQLIIAIADPPGEDWVDTLLVHP